MKLHQLLRQLQSANPVCIFDIAGMIICQVKSKEAIPQELYDYDILEISLGLIENVVGKRSCLYITIQK